jgi:hypothetical protein
MNKRTQIVFVFIFAIIILFFLFPKSCGEGQGHPTIVSAETKV